MPVVTAVKVPTPYDVDMEIWQWIGLGQGDTGSPIRTKYFSDICFMAKASTPGTGIVIAEGTNDPAASGYAPLHDSRGFANALSITLVSTFLIAQLLEVPYLIRPNLNGGAGASGCDVWVRMRGR